MFDAKKVTSELIDWISDYFLVNGSPSLTTKAVVGISGGKDSTVVAALCVAALGRERVLGVLLPQGEQFDIGVAHEVCAALGIKALTINIGEAVSDIYEGVTSCGLELNNVAMFNTPARVRMTALYAVSGIVGGRVANTCNLSERWVGYSTKFGDSVGDFGPLANLTVSEVKAVGRELGLSSAFIDKVPIDGLCGLSDEENLGFSYDVLDRFIREGLCEDVFVRERICQLHQASFHKTDPMPLFRFGLSQFS